MNVLAVDVGGTHVKVLATGQSEPRKFVSGPKLTAEQMAAEVKQLAADWQYEVVSIGYPGPVLRGRPINDPYNLGPGWVGFDYEKAFGCPVKIINDAAMQALGSYKTGRMLFLGLGTGLGSAMVIDGELEPMELGHLPYRKATYEDYIGLRGLQRFGKKKWREYVEDIVARQNSLPLWLSSNCHVASVRAQCQLCAAASVDCLIHRESSFETRCFASRLEA